ncbi:c-type cytochrome [Acidimangrovimonas sediminis]|uniref:c-type cytochrome n=1 Tax=Acidimangrovimonas sediminis TaxID=2056283 RepID=UPI000C7FE237|nr:c-type cytochrome [Acidimangrovimonas sediminis]
MRLTRLKRAGFAALVPAIVPVIVSVFALGLALPVLAQDAGGGLVSRGEYLARAGDCAACHTARDGKPMAGGYVFSMPMGKIVSSNITPSKRFGIGNWTEEQFARAVRKGVRPDGSHLYPAMPYPSYARITDADMKALYAYFRQVKPVDAAPSVKTSLKFPFNLPGMMMGWDLIFANSGPFKDDPKLDAQQNRGKYLVQGLAHCSTCHTPRNAFMATDNGKYLAGANVDGWEAPNLTSDKVSGLGGWSDAEIESYLKNGHAKGKAQAGGPMADAITHSLHYLSDQDIAAITAYLRTVPPIRTEGQSKPSWAVGKAQPVDWTKIEPGMVAADKPGYRATDNTDGAQLYNTACAACHGINGQGSDDGHYPTLTNNSAVGAPKPNNVVMAIVDGIHRKGADGMAVMPAFSASNQVIHDTLSDAQIASVANYVTATFGNGSAKLTAADIPQIEAGGAAPWLIRNAATLFWVGVAVAVIVILLIIAAVVMSRRRKSAAV